MQSSKLIEEYVLEEFAPDEKPQIEKAIINAVDSLILLQKKGYDTFMSKHYGKD